MESESQGAGGLRPWIGRIVGPLLFLVMLLLPAPAGMSAEAWAAAAAATLMAVWWVTEAVPISATALLPLALFPLLDVAPIEAAAAPYANPVIFLFLGGFIIAAALERCGLHRRMALKIVSSVGAGPHRLIGGFMIATAFLSMWVSNTATVVMMLPVALSVLTWVEESESATAEQVSNFAVALLLGVAYAGSIGGLGTLIGSPPNALLAGFLDEAYGVRIGFLQWMAIGVPLVLVSLPVAWILLTRVLYPVGGVSGGSGGGVGETTIGSRMMALGPLSRGEAIVGAITALTAALWITRPLLDDYLPGISDAGIAIVGALLMFMAPVDLKRGEFAMTWERTEEIPWGVLVLFGGGLSLASAVETTGLAAWIGEALSAVGAWPFVLVVVVVAGVVVLLTELTSNTATAATFLPIVGALAVGIGRAPIALALPVALAASCAFMMPVATPPNAIVYGSGRLTIPQMVRAGVFLNIILLIFITIAAFTLAEWVL